MSSIFKKVLPSPIISVILFFSWLILNQSISMGHIALALLFALLIPIFVAPLRPTPVSVKKPLVIIKLIIRVFFDVIEANLFVVKRLVLFGKKTPGGDFVYVPLELRDPNGLATLALICTVTPATIWSELALDRSAVYLHVFDLQDPEAEAKKFKERYEFPLMEIFES